MKPHSNPRRVLDEILEAHRQLYVGVEEAEHFELFVAEQVLRAYKPERVEIDSGKVSGGDDGQIDSVYCFVNGNLLSGDVTDSDLVDYRKSVVLDLIIIQTKREDSFKETVIQKMHDTVSDFFDLNKSLEQLGKLYNSELISAIERFRTARKLVATRFPTINVEVFYATKGDTSDIGHKLHDRANGLKQSVLSASPSQTHVNVTFLGAGELVRIASRPPKTERILKHTQLLMAGGAGGYICLANLKSYRDFITETDEMLYSLFESNVRDYNPDLEVNREIQDSLKHPTAEDFWWLNNGITIIAAKVQPSADSLTIDEPQIVNGLQTSQEIFNYFRDNPSAEEHRVLSRFL